MTNTPDTVRSNPNPTAEESGWKRVSRRGRKLLPEFTFTGEETRNLAIAKDEEGRELIVKVNVPDSPNESTDDSESKLLEEIKRRTEEKAKADRILNESDDDESNEKNSSDDTDLEHKDIHERSDTEEPSILEDKSSSVKEQRLIDEFDKGKAKLGEILNDKNLGDALTARMEEKYNILQLKMRKAYEVQLLSLKDEYEDKLDEVLKAGPYKDHRDTDITQSDQENEKGNPESAVPKGRTLKNNLEDLGYDEDDLIEFLKFKKERSSVKLNDTIPLKRRPRKLNLWEKAGLDIVADANLGKLAAKEREFKILNDKGDVLPKMDLKSETFEKMKQLVKEKMSRMAMKNIMSIEQARSGLKLSLIDRAQSISIEDMKHATNYFWRERTNKEYDSMSPEEFDTIEDGKLKAHILGEWFMNCLTDAGKRKLNATKKDWTFKSDTGDYYHGPMMFWHIVQFVKPNNDTLIEKAKQHLRNGYDAKKYNFDVSMMLTDFELTCNQITDEFGGTLTEDEKVSALWKAVGSMSEVEFTRRIKDLQREYRKTEDCIKPTCDDLIQTIKREQVDMEADGDWNKPDVSREHTLALTAVMENFITTLNTQSNFDQKDRQTDGDSNTRKRRQIPDWKFTRTDDSLTLQKNGKLYHWCTHHKSPDGKQGMWTLHKEEDHKDSFKPSNNNGSTSNSGNATKHNIQDKPNSEEQAKLQVDRHLLAAVKNNSSVRSFLNRIENDSSSIKGSVKV
jgi:hypothetical protein